MAFCGPTFEGIVIRNDLRFIRLTCLMPQPVDPQVSGSYAGQPNSEVSSIEELMALSAFAPGIRLARSVSPLTWNSIPGGQTSKELASVLIGSSGLKTKTQAFR